ncbi:YuzF family protein [Priestia filamentosa]|jgi:Protein of unknown function (DUF2642)|uniref:YuzF family protein n=1 Tax=Priestia TaxID=2800373 RepID=UPI000DCA3E08|nr:MULTISPECIES: YuzF family protein [Priestia]MED3725978.1 YuzF family protein [Priestia filamentosa]MED4069880.1 YuzF family protein [Priestia endophytica]RAS80095.1 hypothetical protein A4U60_15590 [Priestia endophytica]RPK15047.1 hypothetical protein FH5_00482 [Priestia endophytica]
MSYEDYQHEYLSEEERLKMTPQLITLVDPYVYEALQSLDEKDVVIETARGTVRGKVKKVKPDHVVIEEKGKDFYVRICQIIWIMPD